MSNDRLVKGAFGGFFVFWAISAIVSIGITVGAVIVAWHFISKFW